MKGQKKLSGDNISGVGGPAYTWYVCTSLSGQKKKMRREVGTGENVALQIAQNGVMKRATNEDKMMPIIMVYKEK